MIHGSTLFDGVAPAHFRWRVSDGHGVCRVFLGLSTPLHDLVLTRAHKATTPAAQTFRAWESTSIITTPDKEGWRWLEFRLTDNATLIEAIETLNAINLLAFMAFDETMAIYDPKGRRQRLHVWPHLTGPKNGQQQARIELSLWHDARRLLMKHERLLDFEHLVRIDTSLTGISGPGDHASRLDSWTVEPDGCVTFACKADGVALVPASDRHAQRVVHSIEQPASLRHIASLLVAGAWLDGQLELLSRLP